MRLVVLESPYAGDVSENVEYARKCVADCLRRDESCIASHLLFTQPGILDDNSPHERAMGINAGLAWHSKADAVVFYMDRGLSSGMMQALNHATRLRLPIEKRYLVHPS